MSSIFANPLIKKLVMEKFNKIIKTCLTIILFLSGTLSFAGGPWVQKKGGGYYKLSEWWIVFDQHFTDVGQIDPNVTSGIFNTTLYGEYGVTDRFTAILYAPVFSRNYMNNLKSATTGEVLVEGEALNSIGDFDISLKYGLTKPEKRFQVAGSVTLGLPTGVPVGGKLNNLQTGDGEFNQILRFDGGTGLSIGKLNGYFSAYAAYNNRSNGFSDEVRAGLEVGASLFNRKLWLIGRLVNLEPIKSTGKNAESGVTSTSIFANNTAYTSYSLEGAYYFTKKLGVSASIASAFRGRIIAAAPSYSIGIFLDLGK